MGPTSRPNRRVLHLRAIVKKSRTEFAGAFDTTGKAKPRLFAWQRLAATVLPKGLAQTLTRANRRAEDAGNATVLLPARTELLAYSAFEKY